jgi:hypothetical protein
MTLLGRQIRGKRIKKEGLARRDKNPPVWLSDARIALAIEQ